MRSKNAIESLDEKIALLEGRRAYELEQLQEQWKHTYESMKPINLIKSTFKDVASSPEIKGNLLNNVVGLASGYISKKILFGSTHNPLKKVAGAVLQFAVTNFVGKKMEKAKEENLEQISDLPR